MLWFFKFLCIYFWLCQVFVAAWASLSLQRSGLLCSWGARASHCGGSSLLRSVASRACGLQWLWHTGSAVFRSGAQAQWLWHTGFGCPTACGVFPDQDGACDSCVGRWILYHRATREAQDSVLVFSFST